LIERIIELIPYEDEHDAINRIKTFLVKNINSTGHASWAGKKHPRLYVGREPFHEFIGSELGIEKGEYNLEIISPFFEKDTSAGTLKKLVEAVNPKSARIFLPRDENGTALCSKEYFESVNNIPGVKWSTLPMTHVQWKDSKKSSSGRYVHAKVYRLFSKQKGKEYIISGSVNLTSAAHSSFKDGNFETAIFVDTSEQKNYDWVLSILDKETVSNYVERPPEGSEEQVLFNITLRYDWRDNQLSYYWEKPGGKISNVVFALSGKEIKIDTVIYEKWVLLPQEITGDLRNHVFASSFVNLYVDGARVQVILLQEDGMERKPSLLQNLTPAEILEYWSLLSEERKNQFIEEKLELLSPLNQSVNASYYQEKSKNDTSLTSFFDRFAGLFHAFSCLWEDVDTSIKSNNNKRAVYRLFGEKYDSMQSLIIKLSNSDNKTEDDPILQYLTLLCCIQTVTMLKKAHAEFANEHKKEVNQLALSLEVINTIKEKISDNSESDNIAEFFNWYEPIFLNHAKVEVE